MNGEFRISGSESLALSGAPGWMVPHLLAHRAEKERARELGWIRGRDLGFRPDLSGSVPRGKWAVETLLGSPGQWSSVLAVDTEFMHPSVGVRRVIEFGWSNSRGNTGSFLIDPGMPVPKRFETLTGVSTEQVAGAGTFAERCSEVAQILKLYPVIAAYNCGNDIGGLQAEFNRAGRPFAHMKWVDVLALTRRVESMQRVLDGVPEPVGTERLSGKLRDVCDRWDVPGREECAWHSAADDARMTMRLLGRVAYKALELGLGRHDVDVCSSKLGSEWESDADLRDQLCRTKPLRSRYVKPEDPVTKHKRLKAEREAAARVAEASAAVAAGDRRYEDRVWREVDEQDLRDVTDEG